LEQLLTCSDALAVLVGGDEVRDVRFSGSLDVEDKDYDDAKSVNQSPWTCFREYGELKEGGDETWWWKEGRNRADESVETLEDG
jgi:hypothetical protein